MCFYLLWRKKIKHENFVSKTTKIKLVQVHGTFFCVKVSSSKATLLQWEEKRDQCV
jgi:hypothetical protein